MKFLAFFKKLSDGLDSIVNRLVFLTIVIMIFSITFQIISRVFFESLTWTEELSRYLLVWSTFLGATLAYKRSMHISVTFVVDLFPEKTKKAIIIISRLLSMIFFSVAVIYGFKYMNMQIYQVSAALRIPMKWIYIVIPLGFIVMIIHAITGILEELFEAKKVNI